MDFNQYGRAGKKRLITAFRTPPKSPFEQKTSQLGRHLRFSQPTTKTATSLGLYLFLTATSQSRDLTDLMPSLRRRKKIPITQVGNSEPRRTLAFVCCEKLVSGRPALLVAPRPIISIDRPRAPAVAAQPPPPQASDSQPWKELLVLYPQWRCLLSRRHRLRPVLAPSRRLPGRGRAGGSGSGRARGAGGTGRATTERDE